jgi:uncharacterized surface protein with fasciclin (FAS1) repeats
MREGAAYETLCNTTLKKGGEMKKNRLFFSLLIVMTMVLSLIPLSSLAQPPLPDNPYQDMPTHTGFTQTDAFEIEIEYPQYWQGRPITIKLTKIDGDVELASTESVLFSISTNLSDAYRSWIGLDYGKDSENVTIRLFDHDNNIFDADDHVSVINDLTEGQSISIEITPAAPWGPIGFYQPENHYIRLGFFIDQDGVDPEFEISNIQTFLVPPGEIVYSSIRDDALFFAGDSFEATFKGLPLGFVVDGYIINQFALGEGNLETSFEHVRLHYVICQEQYGDCEIAPIFSENDDTYIDFSGVEDNEITISGTLNTDLGQAYLGYVIELATNTSLFVSDASELKDEFSKDYIVIGLWENDTLGMSMFSHAPDYFTEYDMPYPVIINYGLAPIEGVTIPDIKTYTNLYNTEKEFPITKEGVGTISFDAGLNLIDNADQLALLSESFSLEKDATTKKLTAKVDTTALSFLDNVGAFIIFENAMETLGFDDVTAEDFLDFVDIEIYDGETLVEDLSDYIDFDLTSYDPITDRLTLRVYHFTEYVISASETVDETTPTFETVVDVALSSDDFTILVAALQKAGLVDALLGDGPFTVFAPTNAAFEVLLESLGITVEELLEHEDLSKVLLYHVISGEVFSTDITDGLEAPTLNDGLTLVFTLGSVIINDDVNVVQADIEAGNGVVHVIDAVLVPSNFTLDSVDEDDEIPDTSDRTHLGWFFGLLGLMLILSSFVFKKESTY